MPARSFLRTLATIGATAAAASYLRFRQELKATAAALAAGSTLVDTAAGPVEYGRAGEGEPVLVVHGAGGGYDQGLALADGLLEFGHDVIAPSRFGYLRTPVPADASVAAQADAHLALLDALAVQRPVVIGVSAGAPSAIELALRHPQRVAALILVVPRAFVPGEPVGPRHAGSGGTILRLVETAADFTFWLAIRLVRPSIVRFLGVPPEVDALASRAERDRVGAIMHALLPLSRRIQGLRVDSATELCDRPLEDIRAPTLLISAADDLYGTLDAARLVAARIPGAELDVLPSGGHLLVGRGAEVRATIAAFLARQAPLRQAA
jgi:pimeloyl-ACP methyl ester carboxylesterase